MPETTMNENNGSKTRKHEIRPTGQTASPEAVAESHSMQTKPQSAFRYGIRPRNRPHDSGTRDFVYSICHGCAAKTCSIPMAASARHVISNPIGEGTASPIHFARSFRVTFVSSPINP